MRDRLFYPLALLAALAMVALALVWPQGLGTASPALFGHPMGAAPAPASKAEPKPRPPIESPKP